LRDIQVFVLIKYRFGFKIGHSLLLVNTWSKTNTSILLVKDRVIVFEKVEAYDPDGHCWVCHQIDDALAVFVGDVAVSRLDVFFVIDKHVHIWE
jgi:hypothetical protein